MVLVALQLRAVDLIRVPSLEDIIVIIGSDAAGDKAGGTGGLTVVSTRARHKCVLFNWTSEIVEVLQRMFSLYGVTLAQANVSTIAFKEAFSKVLAAEIWGNCTPPWVFVDPQDNNSACAWHNSDASNNCAAGLFLLGAVSCFAARRQNWESTRVNSRTTVFDDYGSRIYSAADSVRNHLLVDASLNKYLNNYVRVVPPNALVNATKRALPFLVPGGFKVNDADLKGALEALSDVTER